MPQLRERRPGWWIASGAWETRPASLRRSGEGITRWQGLSDLNTIVSLVLVTRWSYTTAMMPTNMRNSSRVTRPSISRCGISFQHSALISRPRRPIEGSAHGEPKRRALVRSGRISRWCFKGIGHEVGDDSFSEIEEMVGTLNDFDDA